MVKSKNSFVCQSCGAATSKWAGQCASCGEWNSLVEETPLAEGPKSKGLGVKRGTALELSERATAEAPPPRASSGITEFDRVLGGGLVAASALLVGGDPGIGKSTLLMAPGRTEGHS